MTARRELLKGLAALCASAASPPLLAASRAPALADPQASAHAQAVHAWLHGIWGRQVIAGQQDLS